MSAVPQTRRVNTFDVYVGNLPADADQRKIGKLFSKYGEVHNIWINTASDGNKYGLVKYYCEEDGLKAIEETNGMIFEGGKPIHVKKAIKRGGALLRKEVESDGNQEKEEGKPPMSFKQRNPDIVPVMESSTGMPNKREMEKLLVSFVETPIALWGQKLCPENIDELSNIIEQLAIICPDAPKLIGKPENDKIYGAQYSEDDCWYRCAVRYAYSSERVKVQYIDFGNMEEVNPSNLVELPKSLTALPPCALKFVLHSLWCNNNHDPNALKFVREMVEGKEVEIYTTARLSDHTGFFADIYIDGVCLNEKMLENNLAYKKPGLEQRGLKGRNQGAEGDTSSNNSFKGGLLNQRDGPRKFETEKDEINNLRWKLKNLQSEYTSLSNKAQENDLSLQIKNLQILSSMVRKLRNQFPIDKDTPLDVAISLVQGCDKIEVSMSLPDVINAINACKSAQDDILKCSDNATLQEKIETRDNLRRDLHNKLNTTIQELNKVPLQDRGKQVQDVVAALTKHYDAFIKIPIQSLPPIDNLIPAFQDWKEKKKGEVIECRKFSDLMESSVNAAFVQLKTQISISCEYVEAETSEELDSTLKNYSKALQQEVSVSDIENSPDAIIIASLVQALLRELSDEAMCVDHLSKVLHEFSALKEQITPWLDTKPSTDELQKVKGKLKSLKSKLRHRLADKVDAEENQDTEELEEIAKDLEDIRGKIHKALVEEDKFMSELSQLASAHFPELLNSESDTGFSTYLTYKGLVKQSQALDHFTLTSVGSSSSGMFESSFDGEPVIIKEYFLSNGNHLDKEEFLSRMALYTNASSSNLEPISAVFFDKNNRHAYVQVKKQGELLSTLVESSKLTKQHCQSIIRSLARALQALNLYNFVHGQVQPEFILVDEEGNARLLPPDFSLTDIDRCRSRYTTSSGIDIIAPEMKQNMIPVEPGHSVDIYCLGLLALWIHNPNTHFLERKEGTLDFSSVPMEHRLGIFLMKLLCPNPMLRPTADFCLRSEYLTQPVAAEVPPTESQSALFSLAQSQDPSGGRNSASPASVLSQSSNDGIVFAESGAGLQMIANTRVPPPPLIGDSLSGLSQQHIPRSTTSPPNLQQATPILMSQQQQQYQQFMQQQLYEQQQMQQSNSYEMAPNSQDAALSHTGSFEIGTFDPNAYEVVTSPQPANSTRHNDELSNGSSSNSLPDSSKPANDLGTVSDEDAVNEDKFEDAEYKDEGTEDN
ncbi:hypothetical protein BsWGS_06335 [Bradybaena similaris]